MLRDEFQAVQNQLDQLQIDYARLKPSVLEIEQQLETERRLNQQREVELMESKRVQLEMLNAEVARYNKFVACFRLNHQLNHSSLLQTN